MGGDIGCATCGKRDMADARNLNKANSEFQVATFADLREVLQGEFPEIAEQRLLKATFGVSKGDLARPERNKGWPRGIYFQVLGWT